MIVNDLTLSQVLIINYKKAMSKHISIENYWECIFRKFFPDTFDDK